MFISTAYAQADGGGGDNFLISMMPLLLIFVIFWFFLIRPQQKKAKDHRALVANVKRNDQVLTAGGIIGRITKLIDDNTVQVEIAENVRVRLARSNITEVMTRSGPAKASASAASAKKDDAGDDGAADEGAKEAPSGESGGKKSLFSFGSKK